MAEKKELSFEQKEARLTSIIGKLEQDKKLSLKETADLYKEGKELLKSMNEELSELKKSVSDEIVLDK